MDAVYGLWLEAIEGQERGGPVAKINTLVWLKEEIEHMEVRGKVEYGRTKLLDAVAATEKWHHTTLAMRKLEVIRSECVEVGEIRRGLRETAVNIIAQVREQEH